MAPVVDKHLISDESLIKSFIAVAYTITCFKQVSTLSTPEETPAANFHTSRSFLIVKLVLIVFKAIKLLET